MRLIKQKEKDIIIRSLRSGVVPRIGLHHIHVGRTEELKSFINDINNIADGGTSLRFVIGEYGSGKTFFMSLVRSIAIEKGLVTINADLSPSKRLHGNDSQVRMLISELVSSFSTRTKQDGNALTNILEKFISNASEIASAKGSDIKCIIYSMLSELNEYPGGSTFAKVVERYCDAVYDGNDVLKNNVVKWLRAEYSTKTEAFREIGVREIIDDSSFFNTLKLYSVLVRKAGYKGLLICLDEMVNLYKITNSISRKANYEEILSILNNTLQGSLSGLGFVMCGTPEFLIDSNRGLYSYEALRSRLMENSFSSQLGLIDFYSTVLRLSNLSKEELFILLKNIRHVFALGKENDYLVPDEAILSYMAYCHNKIGDSYFRTPRTSIKGFVDLLSILEQYKDIQWNDVIDKIDIKKDIEPSLVCEMTNSNRENPEDNTDDEFASFRI